MGYYPPPEAKTLQTDHEKQKFGEALGDFSLADMDGRAVTLSQHLAGKKAGVVVFWSSVCSHCVRYGAYLSEFEAQNPDIPLLVLASRNGETKEDIAKVVNAQNLRFRILHDIGGKVAKDWYTQQTPRAFLMTPERGLLYRGAIDNFKYRDDPNFISYLEPAIAQFLNGEPVAKQETASFGCAIQSVYYNLPRAL